MILASDRLPRLLYFGDVPVESSYHGSALLYRLLQTYPADRLLIVEAGLLSSLPERRLKDVSYNFRQVPLARLQNTRFTSWYAAAKLLLAKGRSRCFEAVLDKFKPEAILTVTHGSSWIIAAEMARRRSLPLHLICHDEWATSFSAPPLLKKWMNRIFRDNYCAAAARFCVSPYMAEYYEKCYNTKGSVLYPSRAVDAIVAAAPPERLRQSKQGLVCAFAGSVSSTDYRRALGLLAQCLEPLGGKLLIFGPSAPEDAGKFKSHSNIHLQGLVRSGELVRRLHEEADVLFVPMSFAFHDRANTEISFPSKLTDYTAVGLPMLFYGPEYSSAVRWARQNPGVAEVVGVPEEDKLREGVGRLAGDPEYLMSLARGAIEAGNRFFSHTSAWRIFKKELLGPEVPAS